MGHWLFELVSNAEGTNTTIWPDFTFTFQRATRRFDPRDHQISTTTTQRSLVEADRRVDVELLVLGTDDIGHESVREMRSHTLVNLGHRLRVLA